MKTTGTSEFPGSSFWCLQRRWDNFSAYRKLYSTQHVLINLVEDWRAKLEKDFVVGAIFIDLSKAFDCIPLDLILAKLHAYGSNENVLVLS